MLLFVFPLTNAQLDLSKRKMSSNGSANVKHSEAMSDEIVMPLSAAIPGGDPGEPPGICTTTFTNPLYPKGRFFNKKLQTPLPWGK